MSGEPGYMLKNGRAILGIKDGDDFRVISDVTDAPRLPMQIRAYVDQYRMVLDAALSRAVLRAP